MVKSKLKYETRVMLFGLIDVGAETFQFSSFVDAQKSKDLILKCVRQPVRYFCRVKLIPIN